MRDRTSKIIIEIAVMLSSILFIEPAGIVVTTNNAYTHSFKAMVSGIINSECLKIGIRQKAFICFCMILHIQEGYNGSIEGNHSGYEGGGVYVYNGQFTMNGGHIVGNSADYGGGGVHIYKGTFTMNEVRNTFILSGVK
jgi:hypothetical protein